MNLLTKAVLHHLYRNAKLARSALALLPLIIACSSSPTTMTIRIVDAVSGSPVSGAVVVVADQLWYADHNGMVIVARPVSRLSARAIGHRRVELSNINQTANSIEVRLPPLKPKALYLSFYGAGDAHLRQNALQLIHETELNALVIEIKSDRGLISFRSTVPLASQVGAQKIITVRNMANLIASLHQQGIYTVARLSTFKDNALARAHPEWAVHTQNGGLWIDRNGLSWCDPFQTEVQNYDLDIAEEAARLGFDEIQFDYVRFPDKSGLVFSRQSTETSRVQTITRFLTAATRRLARYNVFLAADVFGYTLWNTDDTGIGQRLNDLAPHLDYISPMLYPSAFQFGIPGYRDPVAHPQETVNLSLLNATRRTHLPAQRFRPWLQAFDDYAYDRRKFGAEQISDQIRAAESFGSDGWMLWNPRNLYTAAGLKKKEEVH